MNALLCHFGSEDASLMTTFLASSLKGLREGDLTHEQTIRLPSVTFRPNALNPTHLIRLHCDHSLLGGRELMQSDGSQKVLSAPVSGPLGPHQHVDPRPRPWPRTEMPG